MRARLARIWYWTWPTLVVIVFVLVVGFLQVAIGF